MSGALAPGSSPQRVVCLYPAAVDTMVAFGLGRCLVGVSDGCPLPEDLPEISRLGEPEAVRPENVVKLNPDLVLAATDQNPQTLMDSLVESGLPIWVVSPRTVRQAVSDLRDLALMYASESILQSVVWLDRAVDWLEGARPERLLRVFCARSRLGPADSPDGWTTVHADTYTGDLLSLCGAENVFAGRDPGRYPSVSPREVIESEPEAVLLPGDPFSFSAEDVSAIQKIMPDLPAVKNRRVFAVDGRLLYWPGTRLGEAIRILPDKLSAGGEMARPSGRRASGRGA